MRNFLNTHRLILHCILGTAAGDFAARLILSENSTPHNIGETFGDFIDYIVGFPAMVAVPVLVSWVVNFWAEDIQLRMRGGMLGFDVKTIMRAALAAVPSGVIFICTRNNRNDAFAIVIDAILILAVVGYYIWDYRKRKNGL